MSNPQEKNFVLLTSLPIIKILIGDTKFKITVSNTDCYEISMPNLQSPNIYELYLKFGLNGSVFQTNISFNRYQHFEGLIYHCIDNNRCSELITYLLSMEHLCLGKYDDSILSKSDVFSHLYENVLSEINRLLDYCGYQLKRNSTGKFYLQPI